MTTKITEQNISNLANIGVQWQSVFTGDGSTGLTAVAGRGYFIDTTSGTVEVTLPASPSAGDVVVLKDYARTWGTNAVSLASNTFDGVTASETFSTTGQTVTLVYMDGTKGWSLINEDTTTVLGTLYVTATGGTVTTSGDFKIHTFTGDGCFVVSCGGNSAGSDTVDYLVVAGGGGGGYFYGGGGGAGGARMSSGAASGCYTVGPLGDCVSALPVSATTYPVTVGAGGNGSTSGTPVDPESYIGIPGSNSVFSTITSAGGGGGAGRNGSCRNGDNGGSGGGGTNGGTPSVGAGGDGNTPPVSPPQGNNGGPGSGVNGGNGGGAGAVGGPAGSSPTNKGGVGIRNDINPATGDPGSPGQYYAGGGNGACGPGLGRSLGGGGRGSVTGEGDGLVNTGGGGGGNAPDSGTGGKGIVIIRYKYQ